MIARLTSSIIGEISTLWGTPGGSDGKESACNARDPRSIPGSGRSPEEGIDYPLQYSCLENTTMLKPGLGNFKHYFTSV